MNLSSTCFFHLMGSKESSLVFPQLVCALYLNTKCFQIISLQTRAMNTFEYAHGFVFSWLFKGFSLEFQVSDS